MKYLWILTNASSSRKPHHFLCFLCFNGFQDGGASANSCGQDVERRTLEYLLASEYFRCGTLTVSLNVLCGEKRADVQRKMQKE